MTCSSGELVRFTLAPSGSCSKHIAVGSGGGAEFLRRRKLNIVIAFSNIAIRADSAQIARLLFQLRVKAPGFDVVHLQFHAVAGIPATENAPEAVSNQDGVAKFAPFVCLKKIDRVTAASDECPHPTFGRRPCNAPLRKGLPREAAIRGSVPFDLLAGHLHDSILHGICPTKRSAGRKKWGSVDDHVRRPREGRYGFERGTNRPQSISVIVPGWAVLTAAAIFSTWGLTTGQLIADMISTAKDRPASCCWFGMFLSPVKNTSKPSCSMRASNAPFLTPPQFMLTTVRMWWPGRKGTSFCGTSSSKKTFKAAPDTGGWRDRREVS